MRTNYIDDQSNLFVYVGCVHSNLEVRDAHKLKLKMIQRALNFTN